MELVQPVLLLASESVWLQSPLALPVWLLEPVPLPQVSRVLEPPVWQRPGRPSLAWPELVRQVSPQLAPASQAAWTASPVPIGREPPPVESLV